MESNFVYIGFIKKIEIIKIKLINIKETSPAFDPICKTVV